MNRVFCVLVILGEECQKAEMFIPQAMPVLASKNRLLIIFLIITSLPVAERDIRLVILRYNCRGIFP